MDEAQRYENDTAELPELQYDVESVKNRLKEYRDRDRDIDNQIERLDRLVERMTSVGVPIISDMPKGSSTSNDKIADMLEQKEELEELIREDVEKQKRERKMFEKILVHIKADERAVIRTRYFDIASWNDVTDLMFGGKADYIGKEDTYLRRVHKIHGSALLNMAIYISKNADLVQYSDTE